MRIAIFEAEQREAPVFEPLEAGHDLLLAEEPLLSSNVDRHTDVEIVSTFIYSKLDRSVLEMLPALKLVATRSTGFDHIDTGYCAERGIAVANVPSYGENTVAEHVFALLLAISHRIPEAIERAQRGPFSPEGLQGFDLAGKTLGVIGTGRIGQHVIRIASGFEMDVLAQDVAPDPDLAGRLGFRYVGLDELYAAADIVSLHVPSSPETRNMLDAEAFRRMKDGVVVINTARGDLIDTRALIRALTSGKVAAAGLDVLPDEPLIRGGGAALLNLVRPGRPEEPRRRPRADAHAERDRDAAQRLQHARGGEPDRRDDGGEHPRLLPMASRGTSWRDRAPAAERGPRERARNPSHRRIEMATQNIRTRVAVNGYGVIGKRVADAVAAQEDMELIGVADVSADWRIRVAARRGYRLFAAVADGAGAMREAGHEIAGTLDDLLGEAEVIVDCTPKPFGAKNAEHYRRAGVRFVLQGGEKHEATGHSFVGEVNYGSALGRDATRVVYCNTTSVVRTLTSLKRRILRRATKAAS